MQNTLTSKLEDVAKLRHEDFAQVIAEALDIGVSKLWQETILDKYLKKQISRKKAIQLLGLDLVKLAEHQEKITLEDIKWGPMNETHRH